ncbi:MAG: hypothetical protein EOO56_20620 [Hymenobacter sp.]|nr:MAG: hypothetical protein EOO56_20620 [Hymenobacter sp.]
MTPLPAKAIFSALPQYSALPLEELVNGLQHASPQVRAQALAALGSLPSATTLAPMVAAITNAQNRQTPWFGFITVSWVGIVALVETGEAQAQQAAREIISKWDTDERNHLLSWLKDFPAYAQALAA